MGGGVQHPIQPKQAGFLVHFIFVLAALGDLDHGGEIVRFDPLLGDVVPDIHWSSSFRYSVPQSWKNEGIQANIRGKKRTGFILAAYFLAWPCAGEGA